MGMSDQRTARPMYVEGLATFTEVNTFPPAELTGPMRQAAVEILFGQVWTRPGLTRRQRRWVSLAAAAASGTPVGTNAHVYGALNSGDIGLEELREFVLHFACYAGWPRAAFLDSVVSQTLERITGERGAPLPDDFTDLAHEGLDRLVETGRSRSQEVGVHDAGVASPPDGSSTPVTELLVSGLLYGQVWSRPQLATPERRLITIACLAAQGERDLLPVHVRAAVDAGDLTEQQLREVALQVGLYGGVAAGLALDRHVTAAIHRGAAPSSLTSLRPTSEDHQ